MTDSKNKIAAQLLKAEMLGDHAKVERLKIELAQCSSETPSQPHSKSNNAHHANKEHYFHNKPAHNKKQQDQRVRKFIDSNPSLNSMFVSEKNVSAKDEAKMFVKTSLKFAKDDMETKFFSEEIDDSQVILNKRKRHKTGPQSSTSSDYNQQKELEDRCKDEKSCDKCLDRCPKHLIIHSSESVYMCLLDTRPFMVDLSNVVIRNNDHSCSSFISASDDHKYEVDKLIDVLRRAWASKGYRLIAMEVYNKSIRPYSSKRGEVVSGAQHFQVHCIPIKDKYYERARMSFKQALLDSGKEWSLNKKLIATDDRRIYRCLPNSLSYFWICFDKTTNGYGHIIEDEQSFSRYFGFEVLSDLFGKEYSMSRMNLKEEYRSQFERSRDFKLLYSNYKYTEEEPS